jgi:hypothetical protein
MMTVHDSWIREFHLGGRPVAATGTLDVRRGTSWPGRAIATALRFPGAGTGVPLTVRIEPIGPGTVRWLRSIGGARLDSTQRLDGDVVTEWAGLAEIRMRLTIRPGRLELIPIGGALRLGRLRIPLPRVLAAHSAAVVTPGQGDRPYFEVDARIWASWAGLLLGYRGRVYPTGGADG